MEWGKFTFIFKIYFKFIWPFSCFHLEVLRENALIYAKVFFNNFPLNSKSTTHKLIPNTQACKEKQCIIQVEAQCGYRIQWGLTWPAEDLTHAGPPRFMTCHQITQSCMQNIEWEACRAGTALVRQPLLRLNTAYQKVKHTTRRIHTHINKWEPALENSWRPIPESHGWTQSLLGRE